MHLVERAATELSSLERARRPLTRIVLNPPTGPTIHVFPDGAGWLVSGAGPPRAWRELDAAALHGTAVSRTRGAVLVPHRRVRSVAGFQCFKPRLAA